MPAPAKFLGYVDENADKYIQLLKEAVAIPRLDLIHIPAILDYLPIEGQGLFKTSRNLFLNPLCIVYNADRNLTTTVSVAIPLTEKMFSRWRLSWKINSNH